MCIHVHIYIVWFCSYHPVTIPYGACQSIIYFGSPQVMIECFSSLCLTFTVSSVWVVTLAFLLSSFPSINPWLTVCHPLDKVSLTWRSRWKEPLCISYVRDCKPLGCFCQKPTAAYRISLSCLVYCVETYDENKSEMVHTDDIQSPEMVADGWDTRWFNMRERTL